MSAKKFLQDKQILSICNSKWIVRFEDGKEIDIVQLMEDYHTKMKQISDSEFLNKLIEPSFIRGLLIEYSKFIGKHEVRGFEDYVSEFLNQKQP